LEVEVGNVGGGGEGGSEMIAKKKKGKDDLKENFRYEEKEKMMSKGERR
jgi:hypothetical protein